MYRLSRRYSSQHLYPGQHVETALLVAQSICSYGCDVYSFGRPSIWKPVDRTCASCFVLYQALKLVWLDMCAVEWVVWSLTLSVGLICFRNSMAQLKAAPKRSKDGETVDLRDYLWWHTAWHWSLPLGAAVWMAVRAERLQSEGGEAPPPENAAM